ncbi:MAG: GYF domain-containing protein [Bradymonadia bacterium]
MRIVCDNCGAKYQISDEKIRNKVFKIRCKKCSHVIVVNGKAQPAEAAAPEPAAAPAPAQEAAASAQEAAPAAAAAGAATWYVVVNREQVGPLTEDGVQARIDSGDVSADTFGWREGMGDWTRLGSIPEFAGFFSAAPAASPFSGGSAPAEDDVMASDNVDEGAAQSPAATALQPTQALPPAEEEEPNNPRLEGSLRSQRNENSVLFSLDMLQEGASKSAPKPAAAAAAAAPAPVSMGSTTASSGASGLIDISAMMGGSPQPAAAAAGGVAASATPAPSFNEPPGAVAPLVTQPRSSGSKWVAIAAVALLLLGGGGFALWKFVLDDSGKTSGNTGGTAVAANNNEPVKAKVAGGAVPGEQPKPATPAAEPPKAEPPKPVAAAATPAATEAAKPAAENPEGEKPVEAAKPPVEVAKNGTKPPPKRSRPRRRTRSNTSKVESPKTQAEDAPQPVAAAPKPPKPPAPARRTKKKNTNTDEIDDLLGGLDGNKSNARTASRPAAAPKRAAPPPPAADPLLPKTLSRNDILGVVRKNASRVKGCSARQPGASGVIKVALRIGRNGRVSSASVKDGSKFKNSPVGDCVERLTKAFQFPAFSGDPMKVTLPFAL